MSGPIVLVEEGGGWSYTGIVRPRQESECEDCG